MTAARLDATLAALADPTRREVVHLLSTTPSVTASELARRLPLTRQAIAKHLSALLRAGLVAAARQGRETRYRLTPEPLVEVSSWLDEVGGAWDARLERLRQAAEPPPPGRARWSARGDHPASHARGMVASPDGADVALG